jgi:tRNA-dihydrouridine synthase
MDTAPAASSVAVPGLPPRLVPGQPWTILAPMQDVSTPGFMRILARRGAPDWFVTEFFRVHETSTLDADILACATHNETGRPVFAQLIGESIPHLVHAAQQLARFPFAGVDLNLGCPAPKVFRKNVGGGLLRDLPHVDEILAALRAALPGALLTVKARTGFDDADCDTTLPALLELVNRHRVDLFALHGRTVRGLYRSTVDYAAIARAVRSARCPVVANGDISSADKAVRVLAQTGCAGLMVGRHAVRNPWLFRQIRERLSGAPVFQPVLADVRAYVEELAEAADAPDLSSERLASRLKKFLNFTGASVDPQGEFLAAMRRAPDMDALRRVCDAHLLAGNRASTPFPAEPYPGVVSRPNCET